MSRAERRRQKRLREKDHRPPRSHAEAPLRPKVGREIFAQGVEPGSEEARIIEDQAAGTIEMLRGDSSMARTLEFAEATAASADMIIEAIATPPPPLACRKGCVYCCHLKINAAIPEVIAIASHLRSRATEQECVSVRSRAVAHLERTRRLSGAPRMMAREPCPLLADGCCSVYPMRPLACRGWNSFDVSYCQGDFAHPEARLPALLFGPQRRAAHSILAGTEAGLAVLSLEHASVDLAAALETALGGPLDVLHRKWRAGEAVFRAAEDDVLTKEAVETWTKTLPWLRP